jgi:L-aspartate oxidase
MPLVFQPPSRYLVRFDLKKLPHYFTDVLVIGGGVAGLRAALAVSHSLEVLVVTKDELAESNSAYAQGGIAGVLDPEDCFESHIEDTLRAGKGLCDPDVVAMVVREAPRHIRELVSWDTHFDTDDGRLHLTREGGHSRRRVVHALGDATGKELMRAMVARARSAANLTFWESTFTIDLLTCAACPENGSGPRCCGALVWHPARGRMMIWAKQTVLATGGAGQLYRETTNPPVATADGHAIAFRAGARLRDMEFMQFHPTVLYIAGSSRWLITEAMRGEGAYLRDAAGYRFMPDYHPKAELAPRDEVSRAIAQQMDRTSQGSVFLDLRHLDAGHVRRRFPMIDRVCREFGLDVTTDLIPVRPGAHYMIGGVVVDRRGRSSIPDLWAAGEVTSSGLHGANRLGSNSLLEGLVFGRRAGQGAGRAAADVPDRLAVPALATPDQATGRIDRAGLEGASHPSPPSPLADEPDDGLNLADIRNALKSLMGRRVGIRRDQPGLEEALHNVNFWCRYVLHRRFDTPEGWELQNMLTVAQLMIRSALERRETRGVHYRSDFPQTDDPHWLRHVACCATADGQTVESQTGSESPPSI